MWRRLCIVRAGLVKKSRAVSSHFARFLPMKKGFQGWRIALQRERRRVDRRTLAVSRQGDKCVLRFCWARWQGYMEEARFEHRVNSRADLTWATVQTWLRKWNHTWNNNVNILVSKQPFPMPTTECNTSLDIFTESSGNGPSMSEKVKRAEGVSWETANILISCLSIIFISVLVNRSPSYFQFVYLRTPLIL